MLLSSELSRVLLYDFEKDFTELLLDCIVLLNQSIVANENYVLIIANRNHYITIIQFIQEIQI